MAGCSGDVGENLKEGNTFQKPFFERPDWARVRPVSKVSLGASGPVAPEQLVDAAGQCAAEAPQVPPQAAAPEQAKPAGPAAPAAYGSVAGDLASTPMPQGQPPKPMPAAASGPMDRLQPEGNFGAPATGAPVMGGIALGMTECQAVRRGGQPTSVNIGAGDGGQRKVVVTYLSGPWPGIYTFYSGRLKVVDAAPVPEKPKAKPKHKKKRRTPARTARGENVKVR